MLVPHFIENIFRSRLTLVNSNDIITIKIDVNNHKKINKQTTLVFSQDIGIYQIFHIFYMVTYLGEELILSILSLKILTPILFRNLYIVSKFKDLNSYIVQESVY